MNTRGVFNTWDVSTWQSWRAECDYWRERAKQECRCIVVLTPVQRARQSA
jgi:hypothetical protein